jgi:DNA-binding MarR family transcriptional regulator
LTLFLFGKKTRSELVQNDDASVSKLFFDSFSKRVNTMEDGLKKLAKEMEGLHLPVNRSQISDLVLLERLQKAEATLEESLAWIKRVAEIASDRPHTHADVTNPAHQGEARLTEALPIENGPPAPAIFTGITAIRGQSTSLGSITTPTELQVLSLLSEQGAKSAPEIGRMVGRSREHAARLMKKLFQEGYVNRDQTRIPFRYSAVERVRASFKKTEKKEEEAQEAAAPA